MIDSRFVVEALLETIYMVSLSTIFVAIIGILLGILLVITDRGGIFEMIFLNRVIQLVINFFRAIPFIILVLFLFPLSKFLLGTSLGPTAAIVPLIVGVSPYYARIVENAIREIDGGVIEAVMTMGASKWMIVRKVMIPESLPGIVSGLTVTCISLISFSAMAGIVGGGGLGDAAYRFGFQSFNHTMLWVCGGLLILLVQIVQMVGDFLVRKVDKR